LEKKEMKMTNVIKKWTALLAVIGFAAVGFSACGDDHDDDHDNNAHEEESLVEHACEHAQNGPFVPDDGGALQAAESGDDNPPSISEEVWTTVALHDDGQGTYGGFVRFEADEAADHVFFSSLAWPGESGESSADPFLRLTHTDGGDDPVFEHKEPLDADEGCVEIAFQHTWGDFVAQDTYLVEITGHPEEEISMVVEPAGEDDHDH
jgi:hypothetical protein